MSGNTCPFISRTESMSFCIPNCKFYDHKLKSQCLIKESMEALLSISERV